MRRKEGIGRASGSLHSRAEGIRSNQKQSHRNFERRGIFEAVLDGAQRAVVELEAVRRRTVGGARVGAEGGVGDGDDVTGLAAGGDRGRS